MSQAKCLVERELISNHVGEKSPKHFLKIADDHIMYWCTLCICQKAMLRRMHYLFATCTLCIFQKAMFRRMHYLFATMEVLQNKFHETTKTRYNLRLLRLVLVAKVSFVTTWKADKSQ